MGRLSPGLDSRFLIEDYEPAYARTWREGGFDAKVETALDELADCKACPRDCGVNRLLDERGVCHTGRWPYVATAFSHFGEEDCLRGWNGSGTIFFSYCNLKCVFCQNWDISTQDAGQELNAEQIAELMLRLQDQGCHNINFVTPEHVAPNLVEAIAVAVPLGLKVPIVYNTSGYDAIASLELMDGLVDIYMPDFKFWEPDTSRRLARAKDYPERTRAAITEMHRQVGVLEFGPDGLARRGVLVRHLVMPGLVDESAAIFRWLHDEVSPDTYVNIMGQYRPEHRVPGSQRYADIDRRPHETEMSAVYQAARDAGLWRFDERRR
ncbi:MAG: radical SAM protein [Actinomycetota bacterium]|nr:radical SAM protein [Actinomycetota bacterium]